MRVPPANVRPVALRLPAVLAIGLAVAASGQAQTYGVMHRFGSGTYPATGVILGADGYLYGTTAGGGGSDAGTVYRVAAGSFARVYEFRYTEGAAPAAALLQASDLSLYGTAWTGGANNLGTVFRMDFSGNVTRLHSFSGADGSRPDAALIQASDGTFYGTTAAGGASDHGTVFHMDAAGTLTTLHSFGGAEGSSPSALVQGNDGAFYGTTPDGGAAGLGTVFRIDAAGQFTTLHSFDGTDGQAPHGALVLGTDGAFYGSATTVFRIDTSGTVLVLHVFDGSHGYPYGALLQASDGKLYGMTVGYYDPLMGIEYDGSIFRLDTSGGDFTTLHVFADLANGSPQGLVEGPDGAFYGTQDFGIVFRMDAAGSYLVIYRFQGTDPADPRSAFIQASDGDFYGTAIAGGPGGQGIAYRIDAVGRMTILHGFQGIDGARPYGPLLQGSDGAFYGSTDGGNFGSALYGLLFRMTSSGYFTEPHVFQDSDGSEPQTALIQATDGNFYGTTTRGGSADSGTAFRFDPSGTFTMIVDFWGLGRPGGPLLQASDGFLYGLSYIGGDNDLGAIYKTDLDGNITIVHSFNGTDGASPYGSLVQGTDGDLYGTTSDGGQNFGVMGALTFGTVFKMDLSGNVTTLHSFNGSDGFAPVAGLLQASDGFFYGTTRNGGPDYDGVHSGYGVVFRVNASGNFDHLHDFGLADAYPQSVLVQAASGTIFGAVGAGYSGGVLYSLSTSSVALNALMPGSGPASGGGSLNLLGGGFLDGATVTVGGAAATDVFVLDPTFLYGATPALPPGTLNDVTVTDPDSSSATLSGAYFADFLDVPQADIFHDDVEIIFRRGVTAGCGGGEYCRDAAALRKQMAVFVLKAKEGASYVPPPAVGVFADVPASDPFAPWIEELYHRQVVAGCGDGTTYCPDDPVLRQQMAVFLLKTLLGSTYVPPACLGLFPDTPCSSPFAPWVESLYLSGIAAGCGGGNFCPASPTTRGQMAAFLKKTFALF